MPDDQDPANAATVIASSVGATQVTGSLPASTAPELPPSLIANRYEIVGLLGAGGMGQVYRAHDRTLDEVVALKIVRGDLLRQPKMLERFRQEVKLARRVTSPNVVRTFDLGEHGGMHYLTMELVDGSSLARVLEDGALAMPDLQRIAGGIVAGMAAAHGAGVLHRDLKPDNVLVQRGGPRVAITDFGIASATADVQATGDGFLGTPAYMAPEQVEGSKDIGPPADVYAFGAIVYEMLTGVRAWPGTDPIAVAVARLNRPPPDPRAIRPMPDHASALVLRCMARDPAARYRDGIELAKALAELHAMNLPASTFVPAPHAVVPAKSSRAIALLPMTAPTDLAEIADGLGEEVVDALTMTRNLRVVSLASVRSAAAGDRDARAVGRKLGVDVIVDASLRRRGNQVRIAARAVGVEDGFLLWANHVDSAPEDLLEAGDTIAQSIGRALTVEIDLPARAPRHTGSARAIELYLEGKSRMRANWYENAVETAVALLSEAHVLAPDDGNIAASLALARTRATFIRGDAMPHDSRMLADRAVALAPESGEAWLAVALVALYTGNAKEAGAAVLASVKRTVGNSLAQSLLGAMACEVGRIEDSIKHLEAASEMDPRNAPAADLARAYWYAGREQDAFDALALVGSPTMNLFRTTQSARFRMWKGERVPLALELSPAPAEFRRFAELITRFHMGTSTPEDLLTADKLTGGDNSRLASTRGQFLTEYLVAGGLIEPAWKHLERTVAVGLFDIAWMERCPALEPLRQTTRFAELTAIVSGRAREILSVMV